MKTMTHDGSLTGFKSKVIGLSQGKRNLCITLFYSYRNFIVLRPGRQEELLMLNLK